MLGCVWGIHVREDVELGVRARMEQLSASAEFRLAICWRRSAADRSCGQHANDYFVLFDLTVNMDRLCVGCWAVF